jgi:hypothetical protein
MSAMSRTLRHLTVTVLAAGSVALAACSGSDDKAKPSNDVPSGNTATADPSKSSSLPTTNRPTSRPRPTKQGAVLAAREAIRAINSAYRTWDVQSLTDMSQPTCEFCKQITDEFPARKRAGYTITGGTIELTGNPRIVVQGSSTTHYIVAVPTKVLPLTTRTKDGEVFHDRSDLLGSGPGSPNVVFNIDLAWTQSMWRIDHVIVDNHA